MPENQLVIVSVNVKYPIHSYTITQTEKALCGCTETGTVLVP